MNTKPAFIFLVWIFLLFSACDPTPSSDQVQRRETEARFQQAQVEAGMPEVSQFTERNFLKDIIEKRDEPFKTYTYYLDMNGGKHLLCESIGYGIPAAAHYMNPRKLVVQGGSIHDKLPQPDPNGLYMPSNSEATYVLCSTENGVEPVFSQPKIIVSPFPLHE